MGNIKARIKATLLRRDSRRKSPSPSKNSCGRDYASSSSTHTQPGYDASDERSDDKVRRSNRSLTQERATGGSGLLNNSNNMNKNNQPQSPTPDIAGDGDGNGDGDGDGDRPRNKSSQARPQGHHEDGDFQADGTDRTDSSTTPAGAKPAPARGKKSARIAPPPPAGPQPLGPPGPAPPAPPATPAPYSSTTAEAGMDLQSLAANSRASSSTTASAIASPTTTTATATAATSATSASPSDGLGTVTLPSIHEHPATPPTVAEGTPEPEVASPTPRASITSADHDQDYIPSPIDGNPHSLALLSPLAPSPSPSRPPLSPTFSRPPGPPRRQSILPAHQTNLVRALLNGPASDFDLDPADLDHQDPLSGMVTRKIWVKRPLASATLITINEDDLVDDVREQILRKYANSLGRQFDAPDLSLQICNREQQTSRPLQPDEPIARVIDSYYANGQSVDDALLINIPSRRTPKASPNPRFYADDRPHESGTDYFPPFHPPTYSHHSVATTLVSGAHAPHFPPSMSIVAGNQLPQVPSPGGSRRLALNRPNLQRMHTASPVSTIANSHPPQTGVTSTGTHKYSRPVRSRTHSGASSDQSNHPPAAPPIPTPPPIERTATPPPRVSSPRPSVRTKKKRAIDPPTLPSGLLDTAVPPINILIVEDNMINLRLLEAFVKRLKVRWQTAINGREAVDKWRAGGFHLVLMDIQLPIMNGLDATREIRRLEKANSIGVFSSSASSPPDEVLPEPAEEDKLANTEMFKSPVIIVALTASSLQSDRHEALAAGCNDFLTKPVNFDWLQRKVKEWGCMQALIDFDGWRKWKDFSQKTQADDSAKKVPANSKAKPIKKSRVSMAAAA
ncbi:hypothetical protein F4803DRAFT_575395 [Xylaria telfairii]|nr:hypothetical protein F4803DRAFT_575395 [Xylaria telfairii]